MTSNAKIFSYRWSRVTVLALAVVILGEAAVITLIRQWLSPPSCTVCEAPTDHRGTES